MEKGVQYSLMLENHLLNCYSKLKDEQGFLYFINYLLCGEYINVYLLK
jgi:hypothetical protein